MALGSTAILLGMALGIPVASAALYEQVIETSHGSVQGYPAFSNEPSGNLSNWKDITVWKGIPFAATTGGANRWKPPQPVNPWNQTLNAKAFGNVCPSATFGNNEYTIDEDCLNLNIWTSAKSVDAKLPVVIWSYPALSTAADFDGGGMADKGVVFVTYNYRTGSFGWLAHPELSAELKAETGSNSSGNWGMLDQFEAVKWVYTNIAAFGGDPEHITVMGQSAGSAATQHILNSRLTRGLIKGAIIQSGVRDPRDPLCATLAENYNTLDFALDQGIKYVASKNTSSIAELRKLSTQDLTETLLTAGSESDWAFTATLDYYAMPDTYYNTLLKGLAQDVPVITRNTRDESGAEYGLQMTLDEYLSSMNETYGTEWAGEFLERYPANSSATAPVSFNLQWTDRSKIGTWDWARLWATAKAGPVYTYIWDHAPPNQTRGAYHESEIFYAMNNLYASDMPWTTEDYEIASRINSYWLNFIKTGNPNGKDVPHWKASDDTHSVQRLGDDFGSIPLATKGRVELFQSWFKTLPKF